MSVRCVPRDGAPRRYLFRISLGMTLTVTDGQHTESGVTCEILPVTDTLPREFQNTFKRSDRNQLAKIELAEGSRFPLNQMVTVSQSLLRPLERLLRLRDQSARQP
jgi:hypothetical protein